MVPNIIHFVFGMAPDFGGKPFSLSHYLAVKSAVELNKPEVAWFHYEFEPTGPWWERAKPMLSLNKINSPDSFMGRPLLHVAHKADVVRLQMLKEMGGIYLDLDTISVKPLNGLLNNDFIIGQELKAAYIPKNWRQKIKHKIRGSIWPENNHTVQKLCNAVLLSEKDGDFVNLWLDTYSRFRSRGWDKYWDEHSCLVPMQLSEEHPEKITVLNPYAFHYPLYNRPGLESIFDQVNVFPDAYLHHLWESFSWDKYLSQLTDSDIKNRDSTYNCIARKYL